MAVILLLALAVAVIYPMSCWLFPFARCMWCEGTGRKARADGKVWRNCRRCRGSGRRLRVGRWIYNKFADVRGRDR